MRHEYIINLQFYIIYSYKFTVKSSLSFSRISKFSCLIQMFQSNPQTHTKHQGIYYNLFLWVLQYWYTLAKNKSKYMYMYIMTKMSSALYRLRSIIQFTTHIWIGKRVSTRWLLKKLKNRQKSFQKSFNLMKYVLDTIFHIEIMRFPVSGIFFVFLKVWTKKQLCATWQCLLPQVLYDVPTIYLQSNDFISAGTKGQEKQKTARQNWGGTSNTRLEGRQGKTDNNTKVNCLQN